MRLWEFLHTLDPRRSPLTDPRALAATLVVHTALFVAASLIVLKGGSRTEEPVTGAPLSGDLGPVDNRAPNSLNRDLPSDLPGAGAVGVSVTPLDRSQGDSDKRDPAAKIVDEALRGPGSSAPRGTPGAAPGPRTETISGLGMIGGGSARGGALGGGGTGALGTGAGTAFFGVKEQAKSYAYVIDCSGSMSVNDALGAAKRELLASLARLSDQSQFGVVFYNEKPSVLTTAEGKRALMPANGGNKERVRSLFSRVHALGGTDHLLALHEAIALKSEVIFFLTDGDFLERSDVDMIVREAGKTRIQVIEFGIGADPGGSGPLKRLAQLSGGTYRYIDASKLE